MNIITNSIPRPILASYELPVEAVKEFDYYDNWQLDHASFFKYKGCYYDLASFTCINTHNETLKDWDGFSGDSWFTGILIRLANDNKSVIVGRYYS